MARHSMSFGGNTFEERDSNSAMSMLEVSDNVSLERNLQSETTAPGSITQDGSQSSNESDNLRRRDLMPFYSTRHLSPSPPSPPSPPYKKRIVDLIQQACPEEMQYLDDMLEAFSGAEEYLIQVLEERLHEDSEKNDDQISEENKREIKSVHSKVEEEKAPTQIDFSDAGHTNITIKDKQEQSDNSVSMTNQNTETMNTLDQAINAGDWSAVANRAAQLQDKVDDDTKIVKDLFYIKIT